MPTAKRTYHTYEFITKQKAGLSMSKFLKNMKLTRILMLGYFTVILIGTILLSMPFSSRNGEFTSVNESLFTATSATCVTGLVLSDVYTHWSIFGQLIILAMIQIGGVGFMTIAISALSCTKQKIGLKQRFTMQESVGAHQIGGIVRMTRFILTGSLIIELSGAAILAIRFCPQFGAARGLYYSVFHSVSAFCNAGIDLMGRTSPGSSMITVSGDILVNIVLMALIITGGLGFLVWDDLIRNKWHFRKYKLQTKVVITFSGILLLIGAAGFMVMEYNSPSYAGMGFGEKLLASFFQSASARTAGFSSVDLSQMNESSQMLMTVLMFIGGASGSTAGGIKITTFAVLFISILTAFRQRKALECFRRRIDDSILHNACCVMMLYLTVSGISAITISFIENIGIMPALFESVSASATVGLSLGITSSLSIPSQIILILLMFMGRTGGLTILESFTNKISNINSQYPSEKISVG